MVRITYDQEADAMGIWLQEGKYDVSEEIGEGIIVDLDKKGNILSIEILFASKKLPANVLKAANSPLKSNPSA